MKSKTIKLMSSNISANSQLYNGSTFKDSSQLITIDKENTYIIDNKRIIIVEDNNINAELLTILLDDFGYEADVAENGQEFLDKMSKNDYDLVLMDCQMPVLNGYDATTQYRSDEKSGVHIPIIAVTANTMEGDKEKCLASGMDDYISKPIDPVFLKKTINYWLSVQQ